MSSATSVPSLAAPDPAVSARRSLILAGGGMRVAYQAGVLKALQEADLGFFHADGTSGGTINLAMLFSGLSPDQMCQRWRSLHVQDFASLLPLRDYLKGMRTPALGDADGIVRKVFPHLGIDPGRIRLAQGMAGTFNVCNYTRKLNEVIPHTDIDLDLLVAAISLPIFMPPVRRGEFLYLDSVWIKDANLTDAVKRGAEELWLVWCIGNTAQYHDGPFNQYVHMIEISAAGKLNEELDWVRDLNARIERGDSPYGQTRPIRLHVIKPATPLPLDPDFYAGRIDAATLIDRGYADARRYLNSIRPEGVALGPEATRMQDTTPGISFREMMAGPFALGETDPEAGAAQGTASGTRLTMHASIEVQDIRGFVADPQHRGGISGHIDFPPFGQDIPSDAGVFQLFAPSGEPKLTWMVYELAFEHQGKPYYLAGKKEVRSGPVFRMWADTTTLYTRLHEGRDSSGPVAGAGVLTLGVGDLRRLLSTFHATDAASSGDRMRATGVFAGFFAKQLWRSYILMR
ncbi:MAG TPA: patatin-like phospholipase family protein [Burkholderiales bacterium]|nr:patatin-like phospholipase family protein [Burkholderiales bacterium]